MHVNNRVNVLVYKNAVGGLACRVVVVAIESYWTRGQVDLGVDHREVERNRTNV